MSSAEMIIKKFGSCYKLANELTEVTGRKVHRSTVQRWQYPRKLGGTDGYVPYKFHQFIWDAAKDCGIELKKEDFLNIKEGGSNEG